MLIPANDVILLATFHTGVNIHGHKRTALSREDQHITEPSFVLEDALVRTGELLHRILLHDGFDTYGKFINLG